MHLLTQFIELTETKLTRSSNHQIVTKFFEDFKSEFPRLSKLVPIMANTPSSSSNIEREFSKIPNIATYKRNGLSDTQLQRLLQGRCYNKIVKTIKNH